jgi:hypothetical protein
MTKLCSTPAGAVLVAIDMSENRQEVLIERPEGGRRRRMTVMATKEDYDAFAERLIMLSSAGWLPHYPYLLLGLCAWKGWSLTPSSNLAGNPFSMSHKVMDRAVGRH